MDFQKIFLWPRIFPSVNARAWALAALVVTAILCPPATGTMPSGPRAIVLHVSILNDSVAINGSGYEQAFQLAGEVKVDYVVLVTVRIVLAASTDVAWSANLTPAEMSFTASGVQPFTVDVMIPPATFNRSALLTVRGNATIGGIPADTSSDTATIQVNGPGDGGGPGVPPLTPPKGDNVAVQLIPMPILGVIVSAAAVIATGAMLWLWKARRIRAKNVPQTKRMGKGSGQ